MIPTDITSHKNQMMEMDQPHFLEMGKTRFNVENRPGAEVYGTRVHFLSTHTTYGSCTHTQCTFLIYAVKINLFVVNKIKLS